MPPPFLPSLTPNIGTLGGTGTGFFDRDFSDVFPSLNFAAGGPSGAGYGYMGAGNMQGIQVPQTNDPTAVLAGGSAAFDPAASGIVQPNRQPYGPSGSPTNPIQSSSTFGLNPNAPTANPNSLIGISGVGGGFLTDPSSFNGLSPEQMATLAESIASGTAVAAGGGGAGGGGAGGVGGGASGGLGFNPDIGNPQDLDPRFNAQIINLMSTLFPDLAINYNQPFDPNYRGTNLQPGAGPYSGDPYELPGKGGGLYEALNLLLMQAGQGEARGAESENILRSIARSSPLAGANVTNEFAQSALQDLVAPGALDALGAQERARASDQAASYRNNALQSLRDAGVTGTGAAGADAALAVQNQSNRNLMDANLGITRMLEEMAQQRAGTAAQGATQGADVYRALNTDPYLRLAATLQGPRNAALSPYVDLLAQTGNAAMNEAIATRGGSFFEEIGAPLLGGLLGGVGQAGGIGNFFGSGGGTTGTGRVGYLGV